MPSHTLNSLGKKQKATFLMLSNMVVYHLTSLRHAFLSTIIQLSKLDWFHIYKFYFLLTAGQLFCNPTQILNRPLHHMGVFIKQMGEFKTL